jgi:branched-chain amino acid transport system substrate-binding protein
MRMTTVCLRQLLGGLASLVLLACTVLGAHAAEPIKVGFSMSLTGAVAPNGRQMLIALEIWRDHVNGRDGLLGRPVELVYYDDQSNPSTVPAIYQKLLTVDKVDLLVGPYATNMVASAMPGIIAAKKTTIGLLAIGVNEHFKYAQYFSMVPAGPGGIKTFSQGFFEIAAAQTPKPKTVAIVAADAEFAKTSADGARLNAKAFGFNIIYDRSYPPSTVDFSPVMRAVQAANPDVVFVAAYPPDTIGIVRAVNEMGYRPQMFGGTMIGLLVTPLRVQLGPLMNGIVIMEVFVPAPSYDFPGLREVLDEYRARASKQQIDPYGYGFVPFGYGAGQILAEAVTATKSLDHEVLANYIRSRSFNTVAGDVRFGPDGEWAESRMLFTQFRDVAPNNVEQFKDLSRQVIVWPEKYATGRVIYPYANAR